MREEVILSFFFRLSFVFKKKKKKVAMIFRHGSFVWLDSVFYTVCWAYLTV